MLCPPMPNRSQWRSEYINDDFYVKLKHFKSEIIKQIEIHSRDHKNVSVSFSSHYEKVNDGEDDDLRLELTPRVFDIMNGKLILDSFYIVDYIRKNSTGTIYDIGCGSNVFKYFFDDVVGVDSSFTNPMADIHHHYDSEYIRNNKNKHPNAIAINSIHYDCSFQQFKDVVETFSQVISTDGYGYITFNISFMIQNTDQYNIPENIHQFILDRLSETALNIIDVQFVDATVNGDNGLDGNIRILFRK